MNFSSNNKMTTKAFCKVCFDAGKPESVFRSHFVKDRPGPNGKVVCPLLLSQECRYCHQKGHTVKHCPILKEKNQRESRYMQQPQPQRQPQRQRQRQQPRQPQKQKKEINMFSGLDASEEDNTPLVQLQGEEEVPQTSWASIAAKPAEKKVPVMKSQPQQAAVAYESDDEDDESIGFTFSSTKKKINWADYSDDEDDDEDDEDDGIIQICTDEKTFNINEDTNKVYDDDNGELVGTWQPETQSIKFITK